jgi:hypothetical protein
VSDPTYSFDPALSSNVDKLRVELGDTVLNQGQGVKPGGANLSNEELTYWLAQAASETNVILGAAVRACDALAHMWAPAHDITSGPESESFSQTADRWSQEAARLRARINGTLVRTALVWPP